MNRADAIAALFEDLRRRIREEELDFSFARSGGPGGQNVNKVNTKVTLWFDVHRCQALTPEEREVVLRKLGRRIGRDGRLHVSVSRFRTQGANRQAAVERFFALLAEAMQRNPTRRATRRPRSADRRRLEAKKLRAARKSERRGRIGDE